MVIQTPLEIGQKVYYWWYGSVSRKPSAREGWHISSSEIKYIKTETNRRGETSFDYFVDGTYYGSSDVFLSKKEARVYFKEHKYFYDRRG